MQRFLTVCLDCREAKHGMVKEYFKDELANGWRIASVCATGAPAGAAPMIWLAVVLEKSESAPQLSHGITAGAFNPLMPHLEFPDSDEGAPVEPSDIPVGPDTALEVGSRVLSFSQGRWWRAEVVGLEPDGMVKIHFPGWDSKWDVVVPREELQVDLHSYE